jgi:hypothetical protein
MKYSTQHLIPALVFIVASFLLVPVADALDYHDQIGCLAGCHDLHGAPAPDPSLGGPLLKDATVNQTCLNCHSTEQTNRDGYTIPPISTHQTVNVTLSCTQCHDPHKNRDNYDGSTNVKLVGPSLDSNGNVQGNYLAQVEDTYGSGAGNLINVRYLGASQSESGLTYPFHDGATGDSNEGICSACHQPSHHFGIDSSSRVTCSGSMMCHRSSGSSNKPSFSYVVECTNCHTHSVGFTP